MRMWSLYLRVFNLISTDSSHEEPISSEMARQERKTKAIVSPSPFSLWQLQGQERRHAMSQQYEKPRYSSSDQPIQGANLTPV